MWSSTYLLRCTNPSCVRKPTTKRAEHRASDCRLAGCVSLVGSGALSPRAGSFRTQAVGYIEEQAVNVELRLPASLPFALTVEEHPSIQLEQQYPQQYHESSCDYCPSSSTTYIALGGRLSVVFGFRTTRQESLIVLSPSPTYPRPTYRLVGWRRTTQQWEDRPIVCPCKLLVR